MKVVMNRRFGGYGLSRKAIKFLGLENVDVFEAMLAFEYDRSNPKLVTCVEKLGSDANGRFAELKVVEIPDGSYFVINEYDGLETLYYSENEIHEIRG